jgi:hypothetical protein
MFGDAQWRRFGVDRRQPLADIRRRKMPSPSAYAAISPYSMPDRWFSEGQSDSEAKSPFPKNELRRAFVSNGLNWKIGGAHEAGQNCTDSTANVKDFDPIQTPSQCISHPRASLGI